MSIPQITWTPETDKVICEECRAKIRDSDIVHVKDPGSAEVWGVCPNCRTPEHLLTACYFPDCWREVCCGTPVDKILSPDTRQSAYVHTCGEHRPEKSP